MAPPTIHDKPKILHNESNGSVLLECIISGAISEKTKWFLNDKEIKQSDIYKFNVADESNDKKKYSCEINKYNKALQGKYKAVFISADSQENSCTFTVQSGNAPEFYDKPKIVQRDNGNIVSIKIRAKSHLEMKAEWFKDDKLLNANERIKIFTKPDEKEKSGLQFFLEITNPKKDDQAKYKCVIKNEEGQNQQSLNLVFD